MKKQKKQKELTIDQIMRKLKKEAKAEGRKLSKNELNNMAIHYMNRPSEEEITNSIENQKVGQVSNNLRYVTDKYYIRETTREIELNNGKKIEQKVFTDFDIDEKTHLPEDCKILLKHKTYHHNFKNKKDLIESEEQTA